MGRFGLSRLAGGFGARRFTAGGFGLRRFLGSVRLSGSAGGLGPSRFAAGGLGGAAVFRLRGLGFGLIGGRAHGIRRTGTGLSGFKSQGFRPGGSAPCSLGSSAISSRFSLRGATIGLCSRFGGGDAFRLRFGLLSRPGACGFFLRSLGGGGLGRFGWSRGWMRGHGAYTRGCRRWR